MGDNGLKASIEVVQGPKRVPARMRLALEAFVERLPTSTVEIVGSETPEWAEIIRQAQEVIDRERMGSVMVPVVRPIIEPRRPRGRPVTVSDEDKHKHALARSQRYVQRRRDAKLVERRVFLSKTVSDRADTVIARRGLGGLSDLVTVLLDELLTREAEGIINQKGEDQ